jgi:hypothetical protein
MGIRARFTLVIVGIAVAVAAASYITLNRSHAQLIEQEAVRIAEIVAIQVVSDRAEYTQNLVGKLSSDGTGAAVNSQDRAGFIQLPAQFVRNVSKRVADTAGGLYAYSLISKWNLNPEQGLQDEFDTFAWDALEAQAISLKASHESGDGPYAWEPVHRIEQVDGRTTLRYVRADPGAAAGCVTCHNDYEQQADVIAARQAAGVDPGKVFALHDLMGAIKVDVPIDVVAMAAAEGRNTMLASIMGVFFIGFGGLFLLIQRTVVDPVHASVHEVVGFQSKVESVVECSRSLLKGAEDQVKICEAAQGLASSRCPLPLGRPRRSPRLRRAWTIRSRRS